MNAETADKRIIELEDMFGSTGEKLVLREDENRSLQNSLDRMVEQKSRLHRRIADHEATIETVSGQVVQLQTTLKDTDAERARLAAAVAETMTAGKSKPTRSVPGSKPRRRALRPPRSSWPRCGRACNRAPKKTPPPNARR